MQAQGKPRDLVVVGGGAAGFFCALRAAELRPGAKISILEAGPQFLSKVRISGGGRCNVTHHCFEPRELVKFYPRGHRELLGPFHRFGPEQTVEWFQSRGVKLKTEPDGRMFPVSDDSQSIIRCLTQEADRLGIERLSKVVVKSIEKTEDGFSVLGSNENMSSKSLVLATGGSRTGHRFAESLGHTLVSPVPSLFTFSITSDLLKGLEGISFDSVKLDLSFADGTHYESSGPLLITHWGLSGPAVLRLSAFAARSFNDHQDRGRLTVNFCQQTSAAWRVLVDNKRKQYPKKSLRTDRVFGLTTQFWFRILELSGVPSDRIWAELRKEEFDQIVEWTTSADFEISGRGVFKEEFVTAGGVRLDEVDFRGMQSKKVPGLFFAGEILDIDGVTGGFNFQNAWTTGWIAGSSIL